jgi:hypothetical protein
MTQDECIVGAKVICVHRKYSGRIGTIKTVDRDEFGYVSCYSVVDDSGNLIVFNNWYSVNYWDIYTGLTRVPMTGFKLQSVPDLDLTIKTVSKECPCGIARADCDYHK